MFEEERLFHMQRCWSKATNRDAASNVDEKESKGMEQLYQQRRGG